MCPSPTSFKGALVQGALTSFLEEMIPPPPNLAFSVGTGKKREKRYTAAQFQESCHIQNKQLKTQKPEWSTPVGSQGLPQDAPGEKTRVSAPTRDQALITSLPPGPSPQARGGRNSCSHVQRRKEKHSLPWTAEEASGHWGHTPSSHTHLLTPVRSVLCPCPATNVLGPRVSTWIHTPPRPGPEIVNMSWQSGCHPRAETRGTMADGGGSGGPFEGPLPAQVSCAWSFPSAQWRAQAHPGLRHVGDSPGERLS